jgi:hypothetical protein
MLIPINNTEPDSIANEEPFEQAVVVCSGQRARVRNSARGLKRGVVAGQE